MTFRVPSSAFTNNAIQFSNLHNSTILRYQQQISSGLQFTRPSEEPIAYRQVTSLRTRFEELSSDRTTINRSTSILNYSVSQLQEVNNVFTRGKTLAQQGVQALDSDERRALALEVDGLLNQLQQIGLSRFDGSFIYGGTRSDQPPFTFTEPGEGGILQVEYHGAAKRSRASVGDSLEVDTFYDGREIFGARTRQDTILIGTTGAAVGVGTDTVAGHATLQVANDTTTFLGASGIAAGLDTDLDTIIGAAGTHTLTIVDTAGDGSAGTVSLNGGQAIAFTNADDNLKIEGINGQVVYVDTQSITAGFNGTIQLEATGTISIDGGASTTAIDFSGSQAVVNSATGKVAHVDTSEIRQAGDDQLEFPGTLDAFQLLHALAADLRNERGLSANELAHAIDRRIGEIDELSDNAFAVMGEQASALKTIDTLGFRVDELMLSVETQISEIQATDLPEAVVRLENAQALLQYNYAVTADLLQLGILNFLS